MGQKVKDSFVGSDALDPKKPGTSETCVINLMPPLTGFEPASAENVPVGRSPVPN